MPETKSFKHLKISRRRFFALASLGAVMIPGLSGAGSLTPEDLQDLRVGARLDVALMERIICEKFHLNIQTGDSEVKPHADARAQQALSQIANPLFGVSTRKNLTWRTLLSDSEEINACTPGGGFVILHQGLIRQCAREAELASVIAHEVGHIEHRHAIRRLLSEAVLKEFEIEVDFDEIQQKRLNDSRHIEKVLQVVEEILFTSFTRLWEHEADAFIIRSFLRTGYPVSQASHFFHTLSRLFGPQKSGICLYGSHPDNLDRIRRIESLASTYQSVPNKPDSDAFTYLRSI
ncbi:MAG: M48 family metallopeptidase [Desulfatibacillum sp.]|nr:M48 family metallopeptidase [Desulfatibacillum sp.]